MICRRGVRFPAPTHRPRLKDAAHAKASGPGAGHLHTLAAGAGRPLAYPAFSAPLTWRLRRVAYAAGRSQPPCRWGDPFRAVAQRPARIRWPIRFYPPGVRSAPPAKAGSRLPVARSAFALRGEQLRLWLSSLWLSRSSPPCVAHNALRWQSARCRWPELVQMRYGLALRAGACSPDRYGLPGRSAAPVSLPARLGAVGLSTHSPCVFRSAPRRNETGRVAPVPPIGPLVSLASGLRSPPETPNGWPPGRGRPWGWPQAASSSRTASLSAGLVRVHRQGAIIAATRRPVCPPETPFGWQGGCTCPPETLASEIRTDKPRHRIIARLYNVGVGGILAQHLAKCCPCRPLQARLTALCEPCGTPPVALAGCDLRQGPARCTSHGPCLDRRGAPHRDRHLPFAPLRSGGPQAATPATPRLLRVSRRPLFRARCASGQPSPVPRSRLRQAPPPGARLGPPFRATGNPASIAQEAPFHNPTTNRCGIVAPETLHTGLYAPHGTIY